MIFFLWTVLTAAEPQPPSSPQAQQVEVKPVPLLLEERLAVAHRGREEAQRRYTQGLGTTPELLRWDRRLVQAYLDTCRRDEERAKGWQYLVDRATAVRDFEKRRLEAQGGKPTAEFLEAAYTLAFAEVKLLETRRAESEALSQARRTLADVSREGYVERLAACRQGICPISEPLLWSKRWLNAEWPLAGNLLDQRRIARAHLDRIGEVEAAWKAQPPRQKKPPLEPADELACRRDEIAPYLADSPAQVASAFAGYARRMRAIRDAVMEASRQDRISLESALDWLDRWLDAELMTARSPSEREPVLTQAVLLFRELEEDAQRRLKEGSRFVGEADQLAVAHARLGTELLLARHRFWQAVDKTER